jgi:hypothetical protein
MLNPNVTRIRPRLMRTRRQQRPLVLGQKGFGADMVSITTPAFVLDLFVEAMEGLVALLLY